MELIHPTLPYSPLPLDARAALISERSVCSVAPALDPADRLYTGNGSYRLDIPGDPYNEQITVGHELLYEPKWKSTPLPPDLRPYLDEIRKHILEGQPELSDPLIDRALAESGLDRSMNRAGDIVYPVESLRTHDAFRLLLSQPPEKETLDYLRWLDLKTGVIGSVWKNSRGQFKAESLCSFSADLAAVRLTAPASALDVSAELKLPPLQDPFGRKTFVNSQYMLTRQASALCLSWAYDPAFGDKGYFAILRFDVSGGKAAYSENGLSLKGADGLTVYIRVLRYDEAFSEQDIRREADKLLAENLNFDLLVSKNGSILGEKMERSRFCCGAAADAYLSGEELLKRCHSKAAIDPALMSKLYDMGRFYQIIDTGSIPPMWGQHNINTNLQVCAGNNTGLFEEMDCYFRYYERKLSDFRVNAERLFGARGLLASVHCDYDSGLFYHFSKTYPHYCWTGCLGWVYNEFWGYYLCTGDTEFLKSRIIPVLKEIALFYEDYACLRDQRGKRIFVPSFSPENPTPNPGYDTVTCNSIHPTRINSVMDVAICREVLQNLLEGCRTLGIETEKLPHWEQLLEELPVYLTDEEGGLKEWAWESVEENYNHRHVSHHYELWPGHRTTPETDPELCEAVQISNRKRGQQDDSAHGIIHRAFTAIRLRDHEEAEQNLSQLIAHGFVRRCLSTAHFPYRGQFPDLQGAMPALLIEMCVASRPGYIEFLPCLPESLSEGSIDGLWLYTRCRLVSLKWDRETIEAELAPLFRQELNLCFRGTHRELQINEVRYGSAQNVRVTAVPGEAIHIRIER